MTAEVEQRIVEMRFENEQFEKCAKQSLSTLEKLDGVLDILGSGGGLEHLSNALDSVQRRFSTFGIAGVAAVERITNSVMNLASNVLTAIPRQIMSGGINRATNIERAQFQLEGLGVAWQEVSDDIDYAVKDTAYGLDEAALAASQFAASLGKDSYKNATGEISDMGKALRAISGVAGMTNSTYSEIANIFTGIAGTGHVMTQDLRMLEGRGLNVAAKLAEVLEEDGTNAHYTEQQIRDLVSKGKIGFLDFAKAMDKAFGDHAKKANETYTGSLANMNAALSRIGADFVTPIHKGLISIQNGLREAFDRARKITKPFAEGVFTGWVDRVSAKLTQLAGKLQFGWLREIRNVLSGIDISPLEKALDVVGDLIDYVNEFFNLSWRMKEGNVFADAFHTGDMNEALRQGVQRINRMQRVLRGLRKALSLAGNGLKVIGQSLLYVAKNIIPIGDSFLKFGATIADTFYYSDKPAQFFQKMLDSLHKLDDKVRGTVKVVQNVGSTVKVALELAWMLMKSLLKSVFDMAGGIGSRLSPVLSDIGGKIITVSDKLREWLTSIRDYVSEHGTFIGALDSTGERFGKFGDHLKGAIEVIGKFFGALLGIDSVDEVFEKITEGAHWIGETISNTFGNMQTALEKLFAENSIGTNAVEVAGALFSVLYSYRRLEQVKWGKERFSRTMSTIGQLLKGTYNTVKHFNPDEWADKIQTVLGRTSKALRAFADNLNAKSLLYIAGAVVTLGLGLSLLASIAETGKLPQALLALTTTMGVLIGALWAIKAITDQGLFKNISKGWGGFLEVFKNSISKYFNALAFKEMATGTVIFAAAVLVLSLSVAALAATLHMTSPEEFWQAVGAIAALAAVLVASMVVLQIVTKKVGMFDSTKFMAIGVAIAAIAVSVLILTGALWVLSKIPVENMGNALFGLIGIMAIMVGAVAIFGTMKAKMIPSMLAGAVAMVVLAGAMVIMSVAIVVLSASVKLFGYDGLAALAMGLVLLGGALALLSLLPAGKLAVAAASMILASVAIAILTVSIVALTAALFALSVLPLDNVSNSANQLVKVLIVMAGALAVLSLIGPGVLLAGLAMLVAGAGVALVGAGIASVAVSLPQLAIGLRMLEGIDLSNTGKGMGKLALGLAKLGVGGWFNKLGEDSYASLVSLATALRQFSLIDLEKLTNKDYGIGQLGKQLGKFGAAGVKLNFGDMGLIAAGPAFSSLATGLLALAPALVAITSFEDFSKIPAVLKQLADSTADLIKVSKKSAQFETFGQGLMLSVEALNTFPAELPTALLQLIDFMANGLSEDNVKAVENLHTILGNMVTTIQSYNNTFKTIGGNITVGIANGILSRTAEAANAMRTMASSLQRSFTVSLGIRSPSRVMAQLAEYIPLGVAQGIQNGSPEVAASMQNALAPVLGMVESAADSASNFAPSIRPVMDLSDVKSSLNNADRMFMGSSVGNIAGVSGINVDGDAINYNMQNRDVVSELKALETEIVNLNEAITNMKLVLDSGTLVGGISSQMDKQFGVMDMRRGRGN